MTRPLPIPNPAMIADPLGGFAPPVLAWLAGKGCEQIQPLVAGVPRAPVASDRWVLDFEFDIGPVPLALQGVRLVFGTAAALTETDKAAVHAYLAAIGPFLRDAAPGDADAWVALPRETLLAVEHQLRNHLNSLQMNAAALAMNCDGRAGLEPYLDQMECDGQNCLQVLRWISGTTA